MGNRSAGRNGWAQRNGTLCGCLRTCAWTRTRTEPYSRCGFRRVKPRPGRRAPSLCPPVPPCGTPAHRAGEESPRIYRTPDDREADWTGAVADPAVVAEARLRWKEEAAATDAYLAAAPDLGARLPDGGQLRELLTMQITEYARHCGHADLLRERVDGRVGQ
ncbi:DUF664 domain-containing protein [Streptomyces sp. NPDC047974]|uniref:mycothiol transferase n=1 Tax=Streptomyces sp. NPDC047974 TaxID=3154343 RepID=UPI003407FDC1